MRKLHTSEWIAIAGAILLMNILSLWCIDVSLSALINETMHNVAISYGAKPVNLSMETGLVSIFKANPVVTYHVALYLNILLNFLFFMIITHLRLKNEKK